MQILLRSIEAVFRYFLAHLRNQGAVQTHENEMSNYVSSLNPLKIREQFRPYEHRDLDDKSLNPLKIREQFRLYTNIYSQ